MSNNNITVTISNQPLMDKITQLQQEVSTLEETLTSLNAQIADLNQQVEQKQATIDSLNLQISQLQEQVSQLDAQVTALTLENSQLTQQVGQLQASVQSLNEQITGMIHQINAINGETVESPIEYLAQTKSDILTALQNKGSSATSSTTFRQYAQEVVKLGQAGDPHTLLLIHFGNETVKDSSMYNNTLSFSQSFTRSSTIKKFGSYSMATTPYSSSSGSWVLVSGVTPPVYEFTYEFWIYLTASSSTNYRLSVAGNYGGSQKELRIFSQTSSTTGDYLLYPATYPNVS